MSPEAAGLVAQIFGAVLIALVVEERAGRLEDEFFSFIFMLGLLSAAIGLFVTLPAVVWQRETSVVAAATCLTVALFSLVVPVAHRLPRLGLRPPSLDTTIKSLVVVAMVWVITLLVLYTG
jgi:hypothetical protein